LAVEEEENEQMKKIFVTAHLSDGSWASCEFTSDKPWVPLHADMTIRIDAVPLRFYRIEFMDAQDRLDQEIR